MSPLDIRIIAIGVLLFWFFFVRGRVINWVGFFKALPGIFLDIIIQMWLSFSGLFRRRKYWHPVDPRSDNERDWFR